MNNAKKTRSMDLLLLIGSAFLFLGVATWQMAVGVLRVTGYCLVAFVLVPFLISWTADPGFIDSYNIEKAVLGAFALGALLGIAYAPWFVSERKGCCPKSESENTLSSRKSR